jgi:hypothetical protein
MQHRAAAIQFNIENKMKNASGAIPHTFRSAAPAPPQGAKNNVQTNTYARRAGGSQIRFILPYLKIGQNPARPQLLTTWTPYFCRASSAVRHLNCGGPPP